MHRAVTKVEAVEAVEAKVAVCRQGRHQPTSTQQQPHGSLGRGHKSRIIKGRR